MGEWKVPIEYTVNGVKMAPSEFVPLARYLLSASDDELDDRLYLVSSDIPICFWMCDKSQSDWQLGSADSSASKVEFGE